MATDHLFQPEFGAGFVGMANLDGYLGIGSDGYFSSTTSVLPPGVTVADTSAGVYTITLSRAFPKVFPHLQFTANAAVALFAQLGAVSTSTIVVRTVNGSGTATRPSAPCGVEFHLRLKTSGV